MNVFNIYVLFFHLSSLSYFLPIHLHLCPQVLLSSLQGTERKMNRSEVKMKPIEGVM